MTEIEGLGTSKLVRRSSMRYQLPQPAIKAYEVVFLHVSEGIHSWFCANGLSLNPDKSEAIILGNRPSHHHQNEPSEIDFAGTKIKLASHVKSFGITLDNSLTFSNHISNICQISYYHIRDLRHIRKSLSKRQNSSKRSYRCSSRLL